MDKQKVAADALLGFVLKVLREDVLIPEEVIRQGFGVTEQISVEVEDGGVRVGIRQKAPNVVE